MSLDFSKYVCTGGAKQKHGDIIKHVQTLHANRYGRDYGVDKDEQEFIARILSVLDDKPSIVSVGGSPEFFPSQSGKEFNFINIYWGNIDGLLTIVINGQRHEYEVPKPPTKPVKITPIVGGFWIEPLDRTNR